MAGILHSCKKSKYSNSVLACVSAMLLLTAGLFAGLYTIISEPKPATAETPFTDFNGDGYADLAIGVPQERVGTALGAGAVNVIYGSSKGLSATVVASGNGRADQIWTQNSVDIEGTAETGDGYGGALATGDFNNDGYTDLAIAAPLEDVGTINDAGAVSVIYGSSQGLRATAVTTGNGRADQIFDQDSTNVEETAEGFDRFGSSLATGDFNNDGYEDLAIGVPYENCCFSNIADVGAVNVIYGSSSGGLSATAKADQLWHQNTADVEGALGPPDPEEGLIPEGFGRSLASG